MIERVHSCTECVKLTSLELGITLHLLSVFAKHHVVITP